MNYKILLNKLLLLILTTIFLLTNACGLYKKTDQRNEPLQGIDKARKNVQEGRGVSLKGVLKGGIGSGTNYEFSSSNPMWRASLEILDFLPLSTVDYSGGIIVSDWYNDDNSSNESFKITVRFFNNEIAASNLKVIVHKKKCAKVDQCVTVELKSTIKKELTSSILKKAAQLELAKKNKKK